MARFMPEILSQAQGMQNLEGVASLIAAAQVSRGGAATGGEAATNLTNLLKKLTSQDSQRHFKKIHGVDLNGTMVAARLKGMNPLDAFVRLMDKEVFGKNKNVLKAQKKLEAAKGTDKEDDAKQAVALARKGALSKVIVDIEAQRAALAMVDRWDEYKGLKKEVLAADSSSMQVAHSSNEGELWYKWEQVTNRWNTAMDSITERMKGGLGALADAVVKAADKFPPLAEAVVVATAAMSTLGLGFLASAGWKMLFGGGSGGSGGSGEAAAAAAAGAGSKLRWAGRAGNLLAGITAFFQARDTEHDDTLTRAQKNARHAETAGGLAGAIAVGKLGAMAGTAILPGWGTAIGGVLGAVAGGFGGDKFGRWLGHTFWDDQTKQDAPRALQGAHKAWGPSGQAMSDAQRIVVEDKSTLHVESVLHMDGREVARVVNNYNTAEAKRD